MSKKQLTMSENAPHPIDEPQPDADVQKQEAQVDSEENSSDEEEKGHVLDKCRLWANWHIFIIPARMKERESEEQSQTDDDSDDDSDRFVPKTKTGRQIGVMQFVLFEKGKVSINSMLCIDMILNRINVFSPQMAGVDRYDDWGVLQWRQGLRRFVEDFFSLTPKKRRSVLDKFDEAFRYSPEINNSIRRLQNLVDIPRNNKQQIISDQEKPARCWPKGLTGRDLDLFKLLSGMDTMSPRSQALSVLNYILQDGCESKSVTKEEAGDADSKKQSTSIRLEPGDYDRIKRLLKRFPTLKNRYPYLLMMLENKTPFSQFSAVNGNDDHIYSHALPNTFHLPFVMSAPQKQESLWEKTFNGIVKWTKITVVLFLLLLFIGILFAVISP